MLNNIFTSILTEGTFTAAQLGIVTITSLICGLIIALAYSVKNKCSRSFTTTLIMLPAIVELVIILVNGNIGAGVAVAGAFSLVRFRSAPGRGQEITSIFLAMAVGTCNRNGIYRRSNPFHSDHFGNQPDAEYHKAGSSG